MEKWFHKLVLSIPTRRSVSDSRPCCFLFSWNSFLFWISTLSLNSTNSKSRLTSFQSNTSFLVFPSPSLLLFITTSSLPRQFWFLILLFLFVVYFSSLCLLFFFSFFAPPHHISPSSLSSRAKQVLVGLLCSFCCGYSCHFFLPSSLRYVGSASAAYFFPTSRRCSASFLISCFCWCFLPLRLL